MGSHSETAISSLESASSTQQELKAKFGDLDFAARTIASNGSSQNTSEHESHGEAFFWIRKFSGVIRARQGKHSVVAGVTDLSSVFDTKSSTLVLITLMNDKGRFP